MTAAAVVLLVLTAATGTAGWPGRLPLRVKTALVLVSVLLLVGAFLTAAAAGSPAVAARGVRVPTSVPQGLVWLLVGWLAAAGGGPLTEVVLRMASGRQFVQALRDGRRRPASADAPAPDAPDADDALDARQVAAARELRGGAMIGVLERLAVAGAVLAGASSGLALVVAVKALGRYPELRTAGTSERFLIGTLASLLWATAAAGTGVLLLL